MGLAPASLVYDGMMWRNLEKRQGYILMSRVKYSSISMRSLDVIRFEKSGMHISVMSLQY